MKRVIIILVFLNIYVYSQWTLLNSGTSERINDIIFQNENTGYICGTSGFVSKTTNAGTNWVAKPTGTSNELVSIDINPGNNNWVITVGSTSTLRVSTNGGTNWTGYSVTPVDYKCVKHADIMNVYVCGTLGRVIYSSTGGTSWNIRPISGVDTLYAVYAPLPTLVYAGGNGANRIYRSTNAGVNWSTINTGASSSHNIVQIKFYSVSTGYALLSNMEIIKTVDGGNNWFSFGQIMGSSNAKAKDFYLGGTVAYMSLENESFGILAKNFSSGSGFLWYQLSVVTPQGGGAIYFNNPTTGYFGGELGLLYKTTNGGGEPIGIIRTSLEIPSAYFMSDNYPNPFNPSTKIKFGIPAFSPVRLSVFDVTGREVSVIVNQHLQPGIYEVSFNAEGLSGGVYFYRITAGSFTETRKMILIK
jgi:photosystem II stability/assembly factor-like uncharacterized protein